MSTIFGVDIVNRLSVSTVRAASYTPLGGTAMVDLSIGILPKNGNGLTRRVISIPATRLLNGNAPFTRTARYSVLMNIITSFASELWNVDFDYESVVFLGFMIPSLDQHGI